MDNHRPVKSPEQSHRRHLIVLCTVWSLSASLPGLMRLMHPAFGIQGDLPLHYHFTRSFVRSVMEGEMLPRWAGLLDGGRGDALFTFYPPLSYLISAVMIRVFGIDILASLKLNSLLVPIVAQISAYLLAREFFDRRRSIIVSLAYFLLPVYPMIAMHRAFLPNALALGLVPLTILGAHLLLTGRRSARGLIIFALSFSAVILTHTITTLLCGIVIGVLALIYLLCFDRSEVGWRGLLRLAGAGAVVFALTAFFLWPQQVEKNWVQLGLHYIRHDYRNYFLFAKASNASDYRQAWSDINQITSVITIAQTLTALFLGIICGHALRSKEIPRARAALVWFSLVVAAGGLFISLPISDLVWRYLPGLKFIQFPWRLQPFVSLACGLLAAVAFDGWGRMNRHLRNLVAAMLTWLIIANGICTVLVLRLSVPGVTRAQVINMLNSQTSVTATDEEGRRLQGDVDRKEIISAPNEAAYRPSGSDFNLYPPSEQPGGISLVRGRGRIISQQLKISYREFKLENDEPVRARIETYYYPHWVARLDGKEIPIGAERDGGPNHGPQGHEGLMMIDLPAGSHQLTLSFEVRNRSEIAARVISLAAWLAFIAWIVWRTVRYTKE